MRPLNDTTSAGDEPDSRFTAVPAPVWSSDHGGHWVTGRHATCRAVAAAAEPFSSAHSVHVPTTGLYRRGIRIFALEADDPGHRAQRNLLRAVVGDRPSRVPEELIRQLAQHLVRALDWSGPIDLMTSLANPLPLDVVFSIMGADPVFKPEMKALVDAVGFGRPLPSGGDPAQRIHDIAAAMVEQAQHEPGDDWISSLSTAILDDRPLTEQEMVAAIDSLITGGHHSTSRGLGSVLVHLLTEPGLLDAAQADSDTLDAAIEETLRLRTPLPSFSRHAMADVTVGGCPVAEGSDVLLVYADANRDPAVFPEPEQFRLDRDRREHLAFGFGPHRCVGIHLARAEIRIAIEELLQVAPDLRLIAEPAWVGPAEPDTILVTSEHARSRQG